MKQNINEKLLHVEELYQRLIFGLDQLENLMNGELSRDHRISCAILADDVVELITECESFLVDRIEPMEMEQESLDTRVEVVLEDTQQLTRVISHSSEHCYL